MSVVTTFASLGLLLLVGKLLAWRRLVPETAPDTLNQLAITLFFPASILGHVGGLHLSPSLLAFVAVAWVNVGLGLLIGALCRRVLALDAEQGLVVGLSLAFGNTAFMGYSVVPALVQAAEAADAVTGLLTSPVTSPITSPVTSPLAYAVVYDQLGSFVALSTVALILIARQEAKRLDVAPTSTTTTATTATTAATTRGWRMVLRRLLTFPPFVALLLGVAFMPASPPPAVREILDVVAAPLLPCMALAVGMRLSWRLPHGARVAVVVVVVGKLLILPALALILGRGLGLPAPLLSVAVLQTAMPVMITVSALLQAARLAPALAVAAVGTTTLLSMATLPAWGAFLASLP